MHEARVRRVLRALLAVNPASFRNAVLDDLVETTLWRWRDAKRRSAVAAELRCWSMEGVRFAVGGVLEDCILRKPSLYPPEQRGQNDHEI